MTSTEIQVGSLQWKSFRMTPPTTTTRWYSPPPPPHPFSQWAEWMREWLWHANPDSAATHSSSAQRTAWTPVKPSFSSVFSSSVAAADMKLLLLLLLMQHVAAQQRGERISVFSLDINRSALLTALHFSFHQKTDIVGQLKVWIPLIVWVDQWIKWWIWWDGPPSFFQKWLN